MKEKEEKKVEEQEETKSETKKEEKKDLSTEQLLAMAKAEVEMWKNKFYQSYADLDNTRKMLEKDHQNMVKYRAMGFVEKLLPVLDNFQMSFKFESKNPEIENYKKGFKMILSQFEKALEEEGVSTIAPKTGEKFDADTMHAISTVEGNEDDTINNVYLNGYMLKDRLVRPAMVIVNKVKIEQAEAKTADSAEAQK